MDDSKKKELQQAYKELLIKAALDQIGDKLKGLPKDVANDVLAQYTARMEGFAEGFQAGKTHATQPG